MVEEGNVVEELMLGETKAKIADDYCRDRTPEEVQEIVDGMSRNAINNMKDETA